MSCPLFSAVAANDFVVDDDERVERFQRGDLAEGKPTWVIGLVNKGGASSIQREEVGAWGLICIVVALCCGISHNGGSSDRRLDGNSNSFRPHEPCFLKSGLLRYSKSGYCNDPLCRDHGTVSLPLGRIMLNLFQPLCNLRPRIANGEELELRTARLQGESPAEHMHNEYQLSILESGKGKLWWRRKGVVVRPATIVVVPPREIHGLASQTGCRVASLYFSQETFERCREELSPSCRTPRALSGSTIRSTTLKQAISDCVATICNNDAQLALESLFAEVMRFLLGFESSNACRVEEPPRYSEKVEDCRDYLVAHYAEAISLGELARHFGLTPFQLIRAFKKRFGVPPHAFQIQLRLAAARDDLKKGLSICDAALRNGFYDQSHLHRHFRTAFSLTPASYQKTVRS